MTKASTTSFTGRRTATPFILEPDRFPFDKWFKHKNYSSFVRQLNNYGFHKVPDLQKGALHSDTANDFDQYMHFGHQFRRGRQDLLIHIQRSKRKAHESLPAQPPDPSVPAPTIEIVPADDTVQDPLLNQILLDVGSMKDRQMELETENRYLHNEVGAMRQQLEFLWQLLTSSGVISMAVPDPMAREVEPLMIQGAPGKVEVGGMTGLDELTDSSNDHYTVTSPPSSPLSTSPGNIHQAHSSHSNSPVFTERAPSHPPPPTMPSISGGLDLNQSIGYPEFGSGNLDSFLFGSGTPENSNQVHDFQGSLTSPLSCSESYSSEIHPNHYDFDTPKTDNPPVESVRDYMTSYGMGEDPFYQIPGSSITGGAGGVAGGSDMHVTSYAPTDTTLGAIGVKRKAMDEPECAAQISPLPLSPYGTPSHPRGEFVRPTLLPLNDQPSAPRNYLMPDPTFPFYGPESGRSPKRVKRTQENL